MDNKYFKIGLGVLTLIGGYYIYKMVTKKKISSQGISFITQLEGKKNKAYKDSKGLMTIGVGHLIKPNESYLLNKTLTDKEINDLLKKDLIKFENVVNDTITVPLNQNQFDSLVSIAFNIGDSGFKNSTFAKLINQKADKEKIYKSISLWKKPIDLISRRAKEIRLYDTGIYSNQVASNEITKYFV